MKYQNNPTWRMLETSKFEMKALLDDVPSFHPAHDIIRSAHNKIVKLQYELEDKLVREQND